MKYFLLFFLAFEASALKIEIVLDKEALKLVPESAMESFYQSLAYLDSAALESLPSVFTPKLEYVEVRITSEAIFRSDWKSIYGETAPPLDPTVYILNGPKGIQQIALLLDRVIPGFPNKYSSMSLFTHLLYLVYIAVPDEFFNKPSVDCFDFDRPAATRITRIRKFNQVLFRVLNNPSPTLFSESQKLWLRRQMQQIADKLKDPCEEKLSSHLFLI